MKNNSLIGIILIGLILIGFSWFNSKQLEEQQIYQRVQDSLETLKMNEYQEELRQKEGSRQEHTYDNTFLNTSLETSYNTEEEFFALENDKIEVVYTTKGGQVHQVKVKDYFTHDNQPLYLVKENNSDFNIQLYTNQLLNTSDFTFKKEFHDKSKLAMRLYFSETSYIEYLYTLSDGSYMVDFDMNFVGMESHLPRNLTYLDVNWNLDVPRLEKGFGNEKNYSTIVYKYADEAAVEDLGLRKDTAEENIKTKFKWFAFQQQFFSAIMVADNNFEEGDLSLKFHAEDSPDMNLMDCSAHVQVPFTDSNASFKFYYGPNDFKTLKSYDYGFENIVPLGNWIVRWINKYLIINIFDFLGRYISNYGIIILLLTLFIKIIISPLTLKSYLSSAKMRVLKPEIDKIGAKYPKQEDAMKKQQEVMDLYKRSGVNMFGGCLPMLIQFPFLLAMFRFFPASFELRQQSFLWADDLSAYDSILDLPFTIPLFGDHVSLFAILMAISMYFFSKMNASQMDSSPQMAGMKFMTIYFMPIFMLILCNNFSSGLSYYYMLSNVITIIQTLIIRKYFVDEEKIYRKLKENSIKAAKKPKSKFQQRLEDMAKMQEEMRKQKK